MEEKLFNIVSPQSIFMYHGSTIYKKKTLENLTSSNKIVYPLKDSC